MSLFFDRPKHLPDLPRANFADHGNYLPGPKPQAESEALDSAPITPDFLEDLHESFGDVVSFSSSGLLNVSFRNPEVVQEILVKKAALFLKGEQEAAISAAIGWGLLADEGASHRQHQSSMSPAFRAQAITNYENSIEEVASQWAEEISRVRSAPLLESVRKFAQESAERSLFGSSEAHIDFRYQESVFEINELVVWGSSRVLSDKESLASLRSYQQHRKIIQEHVRGLVARWQAVEDDRVSLIDYMIEKAETSREEFGPLYQQVSLFLQASVETTASLVSWALILLSRNPEVWRELVNESAYRPPESPSISPDVTWTEAIIKEALRLYPPAWMIPRVAAKDLELGGFSIQEGTRVIVSPWVTHRSSEVFERASTFMPQRWREPQIVARGGYFPFGLGNRICIGERYGKKTAEIVLSSLARAGFSPSIGSEEDLIGSSAIILNPDANLEFSLSGAFF